MTPRLLAVFGVFQLVLFLMHAAIFAVLISSFDIASPSFAWLFGLLSFTFIGASILVYLSVNPLAKWFYRISAYWFGLVQFLFVASLAVFLIERVSYAAGHPLNSMLLGGICFGGVFLVHCYATWRTSHPRITRVEVTLPHLPEAWRGKKIALITDIHLGAIWTDKFVRRILDLVEPEKPEAVLIAGDLYDGVKCDPAALAAPFASLKPRHGKFFAAGDHERGKYHEDFMKAAASVGMKVLHNEKVDLDGIQLVGVDWKDTHNDLTFEKALSDIGIDTAKPSILLKHEPNGLPVAEKHGVSLLLSGHTHGGAQIFPLRLITYRLYKGFDLGLKPLGKMMQYTSSGVGTWGPPLRFGTKSEVAIITLH